MSHRPSKTNSSTMALSTSDGVQSFLRLSWMIGLFGGLMFLPFSIHLPFTWVHLLGWIILIFPMILPSFKSFKKERLSLIQTLGLLLTLCLQFGLTLLLGLGFFWDAQQTPTHLALQSEVPLQSLPGSDQYFTIETRDTYQVFIEGNVGPQLLNYPKSKTTLHELKDVESPKLLSFTGCSHHWFETLTNRLFNTDIHLSYQQVYQLYLPDSF